MFRSNEFHLGLTRRAIEDRLIARANALDVHFRDGRWLDGEAVSDFIYGYHELTRYYETSGDTTIGSGVLDVYRAVLICLGRAAQGNAVPMKRRERAQSAMSELQMQMEAVLTQVRENAQRPREDGL